MQSAGKYFAWYGKNYEVLNMAEIASPADSGITGKFDLVVFGSAIDPELINTIFLDKIATISGTDAAWLMLGSNQDSQKMKMWNLIKDHTFINASVDCWSFGAAFGSPSFQSKISFTYIPWIMKPWRIGLWADNVVTTQ